MGPEQRGPAPPAIRDAGTRGPSATRAAMPP